MRKGVGQLGAQPDALKQMRDPVAALARVPDAVDDERLGDDLAGRHPRVQRRVWVLIDHLHAPAIWQHRVAPEAGDVVAVDHDPAVGRFEQLQQRTADRRFAAAALADKTQRLAAPDLERDAVDRVDLARDAREHAGVNRKMLFQIFDGEQRAGHAAPPSRGSASRRSACQHATQ